MRSRTASPSAACAWVLPGLPAWPCCMSEIYTEMASDVSWCLVLSPFGQNFALYRQLRGKNLTRLDLSNSAKIILHEPGSCRARHARSSSKKENLSRVRSQGDNQLGDNSAAAIASLIHGLPQLKSIFLAGNILGAVP